VLRRIFRFKREEVAGGWRRLHNEDLHNFYASPSIIRVIKSRKVDWTGYVARMGEMRSAYKISVRKPGGKRQLGRPRCRWDDNIRMDIREIECGMDSSVSG
jgi:hypothetical protein